jgi:hypothetical protein
MPSTYSPSLKIELIGNGEQSGTWGQTTNNNMGTLIEQAIAGVEQITLTGNKVLTSFNGLSDEARNAVLVFDGLLSSPANVIAPAVQKTYIITNNSGANVTIKTATGNGVTIPNGLNSLIYCDGSDFYTAVNVNNVIGDLSVSGNVTVSGGFLGIGNSNVSMATGNLTITSNSSIVNMSPNTGALIPPTGTTSQRPSNVSLGMQRWNTDTGVYEVWNGLSWQVIASGAYSVNYLIVAGGGGGSNSGTGGGGGGGVVASSVTLTPGQTYTLILGAGGSSSGTSGTNSVFTGVLTAIGGGGPSASGGSGGGGGGSGTAGQGFNGGSNVSGAGGGGGGGTTNGFDATGFSSGGSGTSIGGNGGTGLTSSITGSAITYAGGGGGGKNVFAGPGSPGANGAGGGSTVNRGGGGQGATVNPGPSPSEAGGSGVIILSIPTVSYTGTTTGAPTVSTSGANTILVYTASGSYTA